MTDKPFKDKTKPYKRKKTVSPKGNGAIEKMIAKAVKTNK